MYVCVCVWTWLLVRMIWSWSQTQNWLYFICSEQVFRLQRARWNNPSLPLAELKLKRFLQWYWWWWGGCRHIQCFQKSMLQQHVQYTWTNFGVLREGSFNASQERVLDKRVFQLKHEHWSFAFVSVFNPFALHRHLRTTADTKPSGSAWCSISTPPPS